jgi:hypothetical protein
LFLTATAFTNRQKEQRNTFTNCRKKLSLLCKIATRWHYNRRACRLQGCQHTILSQLNFNPHPNSLLLYHLCALSYRVAFPRSVYIKSSKNFYYTSYAIKAIGTLNFYILSVTFVSVLSSHLRILLVRSVLSVISSVHTAYPVNLIRLDIITLIINSMAHAWTHNLFGSDFNTNKELHELDLLRNRNWSDVKLNCFLPPLILSNENEYGTGGEGKSKFE